jgi:phosphatidylglycerol---prolipoprotein diacylglyceryl transferase
MDPAVSVGAPAQRRIARQRYLFGFAGIRIPSYPAMLYLGCVAGTIAGAGVGGAEGLDRSRVALATVVLLVPALIGARLLFVLQHLPRFRGEPRRIWRRSDGGAAMYGGFGAALAASPPVLALWTLPFFGFWDAASVTMMIGLIFTRLGCLMHGCCAGRATASRLGVWLPDQSGVWQRRFPTQLLELGWGTLVLLGALAARPALPFTGALFAGIVATYAAGRLVIEPMRERADGGLSLWVNAAFSSALLIGAAAVLVFR